MTTVYIVLALLFFMGFLILWRERLITTKTSAVLCAILLAVALELRGLNMDFQSGDYMIFLKGWVQFFRDNGGWGALRLSVGNYNVPYLYFLAAFSYLPIWDLYLIKLLSIFFDLVLAWGVMRMAGCFSKTYLARLTGFFLTLFLPTVILNGSYWGQCDSIYGAFAVWSLVFALENKPVRSMISIALSFAFKLQAVFLMPVFLVFLFTRRIKWQHLFIFPLTYLIVVLPAILTGRPPLDTILLYFSQAGTVGDALNYNSTSLFALLPDPENPDLAATLGIIAAFAVLVILYAFCWMKRERLGDRALLTASLLVCVAIPFFLPHMHERYFFLADVLSLAFAIMVPQLLHVPLCVSFASLLGYYAYLRWQFLMPMRYGTFALIAVLLTLALYLPSSLGAKKGNAKRGYRQSSKKSSQK